MSHDRRMWLFWMCFGFALEIIGLGFAARGLWRTWHDNAQGRSFFPPSLRRAAAWVRVKVLRRKPQQAQGQAVGVLPALEFSAAGFISQGLNDTMSVDAKIEAVQSNALKALENASRAQHSVDQERRERERAIADVLARLEHTEHSLTDFTRGLVVDGVPLAVIGLVAAGAGLVLQAVASIATY